MDSQDRKKLTHSELMMMYTSSVQEIAGFKSQQWQVTNYAVAIYAAAVTLARTSDFALHPLGLRVLFLLMIGTWVVGVYCCLVLGKSINVRQSRMRHVREDKVWFSNEFRSAWAAEEKKPDLFKYLFYAVLSAGLFVALSFAHIPTMKQLG